MITRGTDNKLKAFFEPGIDGGIVEFDLFNIENGVKTTIRCKIINNSKEQENRPYVPIEQVYLDMIDAVKDEALRIRKIQYLNS